MSEPLAEHLSRFTPDAAGLDRDALLIAAGRASVRPNRGWPALAGVLAASQLLTLAILWPRTPPPSPPSAPPLVASDSSRPDTPPVPELEPDPSEWRVLRQHMYDTDFAQPTPPSDEPMLPPEPPLRAFGTPPELIPN